MKYKHLELPINFWKSEVAECEDLLGAVMGGSTRSASVVCEDVGVLCCCCWLTAARVSRGRVGVDVLIVAAGVIVGAGVLAEGDGVRIIGDISCVGVLTFINSSALSESYDGGRGIDLEDLDLFLFTLLSKWSVKKLNISKYVNRVHSHKREIYFHIFNVQDNNLFA